MMKTFYIPVTKGNDPSITEVQLKAKLSKKDYSKLLNLVGVAHAWKREYLAKYEEFTDQRMALHMKR